MRMKQKNRSGGGKSSAAAKRPAVRIMNVLIVIMVIALAMMAFKLINDLHYTRSTFFSDENMSYTIEYEDFGSLVSSYFNFHADQPDFEEQAGECGKSAQYANAACLDKAYKQAGLDDYADCQKELMEDALEGIDDYKPAVDKINSRLGLEQ